jgi:predicted ABC-class ATPase
VLGRQAAGLLLGEVPEAVDAALAFPALDPDALRRHLETVEDQQALRAELAGRGLIAFVGDGSILPRRSGVDPRPLEPDQTGSPVIPFESPDSLAVEIELPNRPDPVRGLGIPEGVTLIVGGGYHGKSTLLRAVELGIYDHVPGDGRELVATRPDAVKIRAEDGRRIERVDISPFIRNLPFGSDTTRFSTDDASGSTSQAANISEALEAGAGSLLMDEDTSATNFMIRDHRMQELVAKEKEPITPYIDTVRQLHRDRGVSSVLVIGGAGDYFDVADTVILMDEYRPREVTGRAREIAERFRELRRPEGRDELGPLAPRVPDAASIDPRRGKRPVKIDVKTLHTIRFGTETLDLAALEQLVEISQTRAIGRALVALRERFLDGDIRLDEALDRLEDALESDGLDLLAPGRHPDGGLARPRRFEIAAALGRLRSLRVR